MYLEQSPLWLEVRKIIEPSTPHLAKSYTAIIHTTANDIKAISLVNMDLVRDYVTSYADQIIVTVTVSLGDYIRRIYPYRRNLEITIYEANNTSTSRTSERYKAIFLDQHNPSYANKEQSMLQTKTLDTIDTADIKFQLLNRYVEPLMAKTVEGTFKNVRAVDVLRSVFTYESSRVIVDGSPSISSVDVVNADNQDIVKHVIIPSYTPIISLPTILQEQYRGIYTTGIGTYIQRYQSKNTWFVYPLYSNTRFSTAVHKLILYQIPKNRYLGIKKTFRIQNGVIYILCTSDKEYIDNRQKSNYSDTTGFRQANATSIMAKPVEMLATGPKGIPDILNTILVPEAMPDQMTVARVLDRGISSNIFSNTSRILSTKQGQITVTWESSIPSILMPGMPCTYSYMESSSVVTLEGTLLAGHHFTQLDGTSKSAVNHVTVSSLVLYMTMANHVT